VAAARAVQVSRYTELGVPKVRCNAQAGADLIEAVAAPERAGMRLLEDAAGAMQLTARGYHRVLKLARTLADLDRAEGVARIHIAEALSYRRLPAELALAA
jgi:magnesium chelatase family protein